MNRLLRVPVLMCGLLSMLAMPVIVHAQAIENDEVVTHNLPAPPPLNALPDPVVEGDASQKPGNRRGGLPIAGLAPPPARACISRVERNDALMGSGCSCSCDEYAKKPVNPTCDVACGGHYVCWAPQITDAELEAELAKMFAPAIEAGVAMALTDQEREDMRGVIRATRGMEWSEKRLCEE